MLFDTHAHMDSSQFCEDREELLQQLSGMLIMNPGCDLESSRMALQLAQTHENVYAAVGTHPHDSQEVNEEIIDEYRRLVASSPKIKAIGEIGLDYHWPEPAREVQHRAFRMQLQLAKELGLPVIIHDRDAHADVLSILEEFPEVCGVFHCYSGHLEMAKILVKKGWYIGFTGVMTYKNAQKALEVAAGIPLERIVLETDCPYLTPTPHRHQRNYPGYLHFTAEKMAEVRGMTVEEIEKITLENGKRLYRIAE